MGLLVEKLTLDAFLVWENTQDTRNEFYRGEVFAMVGARRSHGTVVSNLVRHLGNALEGSSCRVFHEGMKVQVAEDAIFYPDVFVTCDKADLITEMLFKALILVIEVLSPATESYDRSQKFALYRALPSLKEYLLISPETRRVESFLRGADGLFVLHDMSESDTVRFLSLDIRVPAAAVFAGL
ncbi:MAG: Uma2 family endonuclease [Betaproteobacteria bacterium]|nr:Uma2 family endonuclease [Betaproteobacteria bacterium]